MGEHHAPWVFTGAMRTAPGGAPSERKLAELVLKLRCSDDWQKRSHAADDLGSAGDPRSLAWLVDAMTDPNESLNTRSHAGGALRGLGGVQLRDAGLIGQYQFEDGAVGQRRFDLAKAAFTQPTA